MRKKTIRSTYVELSHPSNDTTTASSEDEFETDEEVVEEVEGQGEGTERQVSEAVVPPRTPTRSSTAKMAELDKTFTLSTYRAEKGYPLFVASVQLQPDLQDMLQTKPRILGFSHNLTNPANFKRVQRLLHAAADEMEP